MKFYISTFVLQIHFSCCTDFLTSDINYLYSRYSEVWNLKLDMYRGPALCLLTHHTGQTKVCPHQILLASLHKRLQETHDPQAHLNHLIHTFKSLRCLKRTKLRSIIRLVHYMSLASSQSKFALSIQILDEHQ